MVKGKLVANTDTLPYRGTSAGGGYTTVGDLLRFASAMPSLPDNPRRYAYGFMDEMVAGTRCFGHDGGAPGMNGDLNICPGPGYVIVSLANMDPPSAEIISGFVENSLPR